MSLRLREVNGTMIAICAVESDPKEGDIYLDDRHHEALSALFANHWNDYIPWAGSEPWSSVTETQKVRDAQEELIRWLKENEVNNGD